MGALPQAPLLVRRQKYQSFHPILSKKAKKAFFFPAKCIAPYLIDAKVLVQYNDIISTLRPLVAEFFFSLVVFCYSLKLCEVKKGI